MLSIFSLRANDLLKDNEKVNVGLSSKAKYQNLDQVFNSTVFWTTAAHSTEQVIKLKWNWEAKEQGGRKM